MSPNKSFHPHLSTIQKEGEYLKQEVRSRLVGYVVAALGLVAGLAWNDAIKAVIEYIFPIQQDTVQAKILYAFLVTLMIVGISVFIVKLPLQDQRKE